MPNLFYLTTPYPLMTLLLHKIFTSCQSAAATGCRKSFALLSLGWQKDSIFGFYCSCWLPLRSISFFLIGLSSTRWTLDHVLIDFSVRWASSASARFTLACGHWHITTLFDVSFFRLLLKTDELIRGFAAHAAEAVFKSGLSLWANKLD